MNEKHNDQESERHVKIKNPLKPYQPIKVADEKMKAWKVFGKSAPGTLFKNDNGHYYIKLSPSYDRNLEGFIVDLFDGELIHFSRAGILTPIYGNQIMW